MDDMADFADEAKEINECIATSFAVPDGFDEADFENEFAALEEEMRMESLAGLSQPSSRPAYLDTPAAAAPAPSGGYPAGTEPAAVPSAPAPSAPAPAGVETDPSAAA